MSTIPKDIMEKIEDYVKGSKPAWINPRQVDCEFGYQLATDGREEDRACPCKYLDEPCNEMCTCKNGLYSTGCLYCCTYGSLEQRKEQAKKLKAKLDGREELEKELAKLKTPIGSDEYWNKLDQNFGKTQEYHYKGEKCVAGCKNFSHYETKHHPDCPFYKNSLSKSTDDQITALQSQCTEKEKECEDWKDAVKKWQELYRIETERLEELKAEKERLKGLIKDLHDKHLVTKKDREGLWNYYCKTNNL